MAPFTTTAVPPSRQNEMFDEGASTVQYEDEWEKANAELQVIWSTTMDQCNYYKTPSFYKNVKCLLISWDKACDDLHTDEEVSKLANVLETRFRYKVSRVYLNSNSHQLPHIQLVKYASDFLFAEDAYQTLLLVYYAGHGSPKSSAKGRHGLTLSGSRRPSENPREVNEIVWGYIENIFQDTRADVLEIFDCCYAGDLDNTRQPRSNRSFEFLGACSSGNTTVSPGPESFTTALIWALETFVEENPKFVVSELSRKIRAAPNFPETQVPVQLDRGSHSIQRIMLAPLPETGDEGHTTLHDSHVSGSQGLLNLNLIFNEVPTKDSIKRFGEALNHHMYSDEMPVNRILWGGLTSWEGIELKAVKAFQAAVKRKRISRASKGEYASGEKLLPGIATPSSSTGFLSASPTPMETPEPTAKKIKELHA